MSVYGSGITRSKHEIVSTDIASVKISRKTLFLKIKPKCRDVYAVIL